MTLKGVGAPAGAGREAVVGWLAGVATAAEPRLTGGELQALQTARWWVAAKRRTAGGCPRLIFPTPPTAAPCRRADRAEDAGLLSLAAIVLRLCRPFLDGYLAGPAPKWADLFDRHLQASRSACSLLRALAIARR